MKSPAFAGLVLALAAPAFAQSSSAPSEPAASPGMSQDAPAPAAAAPAASDPASIIKAEFPVYDKDANGSLNKMEMATWLKALKTASPDTKPMAAADETKWIDTSFKDADADKSASVSVAELTSYLTKGS
jgi:hypothetical protein